MLFECMVTIKPLHTTHSTSDIDTKYHMKSFIIGIFNTKFYSLISDGDVMQNSTDEGSYHG